MKKLLIIFFLTASCSMTNDKLENNFSDINFSDDRTYNETTDTLGETSEFDILLSVLARPTGSVGDGVNVGLNTPDIRGKNNDNTDLFDFHIFVDADLDKCIDRLKQRNKCIPGYTAEEIEKRCDKVDRANAILVQQSRIGADKIVQSIV